MKPSYKALERAFPGKGRQLRALLDKQAKTTDYASVRAWEQKCYNAPSYLDRLQCAFNEILEGHGTEAVFGEGEMSPDACYINLGDPYATTLLYDYTRGRWLITSWGDWVESQSRTGIEYP